MSAESEVALDARRRSLWLDGLAGALEPRPPLVGDVACDVAVVGAGFTGLWTAYWLKRHAPALDVAVVEREIAGFGASGRNGGWVSGEMAGNPAVYARRHGVDAVRAGERLTYRAVGEIAEIVARERIDCGLRHAGRLSVATTEAQAARIGALIEWRRRWGAGEADLRAIGLQELEGTVRVAGARAALHTPHCARVDPARLVRGLAAVAEQLGVRIYERTAATEIAPGLVATAHGRVRARHVVQATEAFSVELPGQRRRYLPLYSTMIATEPLDAAAWREIGLESGTTVGDLRHLFFYAQRTDDDRLALGGRGAPYRLGSPLSEAQERNPLVAARLRETIARHFPAAAAAAVTHCWGGAVAVPRDWCHAVRYDRASGLGSAGGYAGHGVVASFVAGRTLADLILGRDSELVRMPWVGHRSRRWEPEPVRFVASQAIVRTLEGADRAEERRARPARRVALVRPFLAGGG